MSSQHDGAVDEDQKEVSNLAMKLRHWDQITRYSKYPADPEDFIVPTPPLSRKKSKHRPKISNSEILSIAHKALVDYEKQADIAREYRISIPRVSTIIKKVRENKEIFR